MGNAWLKDAISKAAEVVEIVLDNVDEVGTKILETLEELDDRLDKVLNAEAQPPVEDGPVEKNPSLEDMLDYIYKETRKRGHMGGWTEDTFKTSMRSVPGLVKSSYDAYKASEESTGDSSAW